MNNNFWNEYQIYQTCYKRRTRNTTAKAPEKSFYDRWMGQLMTRLFWF